MNASSETNRSNNRRRNVTISVVIALLSSTVMCLSANFLADSRLENIGQDLFSRTARANTRLPPSVKVILIDENSLQYMEPLVGRWPWPRRVFKDVIEFINLGGPRAIHFDILFSERETGANSNSNDDNDRVLAQSSANAGNIVHAMQLLREDETNSVENQKTQRIALPAGVVNLSLDQLAGKLKDGWYTDYLVPYPELLKASLNLGIVNAYVDNDGIYRSTQSFYRYGSSNFAALSIAAALRLKDPAVTRHLQSIVSRQGLHKVNFYADVPAYSLGGIIESARQLKNGDSDDLLINPDEFANSYVFIGASAIGLHDLKATPMSTLTPGVFVHASYLANLLENDLLEALDPKLSYLLIPLLSLLVALLVLNTRILSLQLLAPLFLAVIYLGIANYLRHHNLQIALSAPLLSIIISAIAAYAYLFSVEERERKQVRAMFSRYVSPAALNLLLNQMENARSAASGSREFITVLFADMRGFTTLSENLPAEDIVRILNHYFSVMTDIVFRHNGTVDKFIGDAIMATWGAPLPTQTHALDAVRCAQSMQAAISEVNQWLEQQNLPGINIGIGIHSGEAIMGSLGSQQKADFTVIGDTVNMASRLEGVTKLYQRVVVISEHTWRQIHQHIDCQILDCIKVKGKHIATRIYTPLSPESGCNSMENKRIVVESERAFDLYSQQKWQACLALLQNLPATARLPHLEQRCQDYQQHAPEATWDAVHSLQSK